LPAGCALMRVVASIQMNPSSVLFAAAIPLNEIAVIPARTRRKIPIRSPLASCVPPLPIIGQGVPPPMLSHLLPLVLIVAVCAQNPPQFRVDPAWPQPLAEENGVQ